MVRLLDRIRGKADIGTVRSMIPGVLDLIVPGSGHFAVGRRRVGLLFLIPPLLLVIALVAGLVTSGPLGLLEIAVAPGVLPALAILNVALAVWRIAAGIDTARRQAWTLRSGAMIGVAIVVLVVVPHLVVGQYIASANDFLDSTFGDVADVPENRLRPTKRTRPTWRRSPPIRRARRHRTRAAPVRAPRATCSRTRRHHPVRRSRRPLPGPR